MVVINYTLDNIPTELWLILACANGDIKKAQNILSQPINWDMFFHLSEHHRVYPLVYKTIRQMKNPVVPQYVISQFQQKIQGNVMRSISMAGETVQIVTCFKNNSIRSFVLKGESLSWRLYGDITSRISKDIDIFIAPDKIHKAQEILVNEGYQIELPVKNMTPRQLQLYYRSNNEPGYVNHVVLRHREKDIIMELHWELSKELKMPSESKSLEVSGNAISVLSDEIWLLYLIQHGAIHAWFRLQWLVDIAKFIQVGDIDWDYFKMIMDRSNIKHLFHQAMILANQLLEVPVPTNIQSDLEHDKTALRLAHMAMNICLASAESEINGTADRNVEKLMKVYNFYMRLGWKNKTRYILHAFSPNVKDIMLITLPDLLYPLYYIIRPFTYLGRRLRKFFAI